MSYNFEEPVDTEQPLTATATCKSPEKVLRRREKTFKILIAAIVAGLATGVLLKFWRNNPFQYMQEEQISSLLPVSPNASLINNERLPLILRPLHYTLTLAPFIYSENASEFYFTGSVRISVRVLQDTKNFKLHQKGLRLAWPEVKDIIGNDSIAVKSVAEDPIRQWISVSLFGTLQAGKLYSITIKRFNGHLNFELYGLYVSSYKENDSDTAYLAVSQLQPIYARRVFPCFDEPALKATFDVSLVRRSDFNAMSNMPSLGVNNVSATDWFNEMVKFSPESMTFVKEDFETTPVMSTYLLAFVVSQFSSSTAIDSKGRRYTNWIQPRLLNYTNRSIDYAIKCVEYFETLLNSSYVLDETNQAAIPQLKLGAMENWGLILYRESYLVHNEDFDKASEKQTAVTIIAHEVVHQWFGNLVTMAWWNDLWLNEAFATFYSYFAVDAVHPDWEMDAQFISVAQYGGMLADEFDNHPLQANVQSDNISSLVDFITYRKGASVLRMMYNSIGSEIFQAGVNDYLKNRSFLNTQPETLYQSLTQQTKINEIDIDVGEVMDTWVKQAGYPVLNCRRVAANELSIEQEIFRTRSRPGYASSPNVTWIVPITMATNENITSWDGSNVSHLVYWMSKKSQGFSLTKSASWYLVNLKSSGFYRVNYDTQNWRAIIRQLSTNHTVFTPQDRARLIDDACALSVAGVISYRFFIAMACKYMQNETHFVPWRVFFNFVDSATGFPLLLLHCPLLVNRVYQYSKTLEEPPASHLSVRLRELISEEACSAGYAACLADAEKECRRLVESNFTHFPAPEMRRPTLCACSFSPPYNASLRNIQALASLLESEPSLTPKLRKEITAVRNFVAKNGVGKKSVTECIPWLEVVS